MRLARLRQQMFAKVASPRIGPYHVVRPIGRGGMGLVFAAWDPSLDRLVAIKVLRDPMSRGSGNALRREAIALARLRHANVVPVFEVGEHEGQVYLAMEFVEGQTLRAWVRAWREAPRRNLRALLDVFVQAASGLAAAHAAGLAHHDVKPENIMLDAEGRVRVMDFGLARPGGDPTPTQEVPPLAAPAPASATLRTRGLLGTPAYMAPEQFEGATAGPAADQFALCACLFEVLYGRRARPERLEAAAAVADRPIALPADRRVPRQLRRLVARGLAIDPEQRWPSMLALAEELARLRRSRWSRWIGLGAVALASTGLAVGFAVARRDDVRCTGGAASLAEIWDVDRAMRVAATVDAAGAAFAADAWRRLTPELDAYGAQWVAGYRDSCEAAQLRGEISAEQMDLRIACLADRRRHLDALIDLVEAGGTEPLARAEESLATLPSIDACADARYVARQRYRSRETDVTRALDDRLVRSAAALAAGDPEGARAAADDALGQARASEDRPAIARAELALGLAQESLLEATAAHEMLIAAYADARGEQLADVAAEAAIALVRLCGVDLSRFDEGLWWLRLAELDGADLDGVALEVRRHLAAAALLDAAGRSREGLTRAEAARDLLRDKVGTADRAFASAELEVGRLHLLTGDAERGAEIIAAAASSLETALGAEHPAYASVERALAHAAGLSGDVQSAIRHAQRAIELTERAVGQHHIALVPDLESLASGLSLAGRKPEAIAALDRAIALSRPQPLHDVALAKLHGRRADLLAPSDPQAALAAFDLAYGLARGAVGEQHRVTIRILVGKGSVLGEIGRVTEADETLSVALLVGKTVLGDEHPDVGEIHLALALQYEREAKHDRALEHHLARLGGLERLHGPDAYPLGAAQGNVCVGLIRLERGPEALTHCRRAVEIIDRAIGGSHASRAELHNTLGGALGMIGHGEEAKAEFEAARKGWRAALGPGSIEETTPINNLGVVAERAGDCDRAEAYFREALTIREARLGPHDASLTGPRQSIARWEWLRKHGPSRDAVAGPGRFPRQAPIAP